MTVDTLDTLDTLDTKESTVCLGIPAEVVDLLADHPDLAEVDLGGERRAINIGMLADEALAPGDWVLIHMGFALSVIDEEEAHAALAFLSHGGDEPDDFGDGRAVSAAVAREP